MLSLVLLSTLLVCSSAAWDSDSDRDRAASRSGAVHHLSLVYGPERIQSHFLSHSELDDAVQSTQRDQEWSSSSFVEYDADHRRFLFSPEKDVNENDRDRKERVLPQLACVLYAAGPQAKEKLFQAFGAEHVSTLHASQRDNRACFLVTTTLLYLQQVMEGGGVGRSGDMISRAISSNGDSGNLRSIDFVLWTSIPTALKLHPSTLHYLGLLAHHPQQEELTRLSTLKNPSPRAIDLTKTQLVLTIAAASTPGKASSSSGVTEIVQQLQQELNRHESSTPSALLTPILQLYGGRRGHLWSLAAAELEEKMDPQHPTGHAGSGAEGETKEEGGGACYFSSLQVVAEGSSGVIIRDLHQLHESSPHPTSCVTSLLALLSHHPSVVDIRLRHDKTSFNNYIKSIVQSEVYGQGEALYPYLQAGLDGTGQVIGIGDSGLDERSCFFNEGDSSLMTRSDHTAPVTNLTRRKVVQYVAYKGDDDTEGGHGTHVSGTVAGSVQTAPNSQQSAEEEDKMRLYSGHAPGAKIAFFDMSEDGHSIYYPSPLGENVFGPAQMAGAHLHTNSWGGPFNFYDSDTISADQFQLQHEDFLVLFAAGNDGSDGYFSVADPAVSKNSLTVGASMTNKTIERVAFFSSLGPTFDQRIKPDVVAPGYFTYSACASAGGNRGNVTCTVLSHAGTSMATPAVAGTAALIRQYFAGNTDNDNAEVDDSIIQNLTAYQQVCRSTYPRCQQFSPRGATVKAMLIHSGEAMEEYYTGRYNTTTTEPTAPLLNAPPDMYQGFGRIALPNVLPYPGIEEVLDLYVEELALDSLQEVRYTVVVQDNTRPLKATVVWMDPLNHVISSRLLLHDIDLRVIGPSGEVYHGNNQPGDEMNNVEQVSIAAPLVNVSYLVVLQAKIFTESVSQSISLVITSGAGLVSDKVVKSTEAQEASNALSCGDQEQMVVIRKSDRGGDGWGGGYYQVHEGREGGVLVLNATMASTASSDIIGYDAVCLAVGVVYNISLHGADGAEHVEEMGVTVQQCGVYLSEYQPSALLEVTGVDSCNPCRTGGSGGGGEGEEGDFYSLQLVLVGSFYGIPYGWKGTSKYTLTSVDSSSSVATLVSEGTLLVGMLEERAMCLPALASYQVVLNSVPLSDDFLDDDWLGGFLGVNEYRIGVLGCNNTRYWQEKLANTGSSEEEEEVTSVGKEEDMVLAKPGHVIHIDIGANGRCEMYVDSPPSDKGEPFPWYLELLVSVLSAVLCSGIIIACLYCRGMRPAQGGKGGLLEQQEGGRGGWSDVEVEGQGKTQEQGLGQQSQLQLDYEEEDDEEEDDEGDEGVSGQKNHKSKGARAFSALKLGKLRGGGGSKQQKHKYSNLK